VRSILFFVLAGLFEIGGGYLVWLWLREHKSIAVGLAGMVVLALYGVVPPSSPRRTALAASTPPTAPSSSSSRSSGDGPSTDSDPTRATPAARSSA
jgi:hypothetical protein